MREQQFGLSKNATLPLSTTYFSIFEIGNRAASRSVGYSSRLPVTRGDACLDSLRPLYVQSFCAELDNNGKISSHAHPPKHQKTNSCANAAPECGAAHARAPHGSGGGKAHER